MKIVVPHYRIALIEDQDVIKLARHRLGHGLPHAAAFALALATPQQTRPLVSPHCRLRLGLGRSKAPLVFPHYRLCL